MSDPRSGADPELAKMKCVPCRGGVPPMKQPQIDEWLARLGNDWHVVDDHHLEREYRFPDFRAALEFVNRVGAIAESEGHHPDLELAWGRVGVKIFTHKIDGLTESDFVLAAKIAEEMSSRA
jgi:4a-hydroxytetrahydrobiopterin dehydratase